MIEKIQSNNEGKEFELQVYLPKSSIMAEERGDQLLLDFKVDSKVPCSVRVSVCVTEQKDSNNLPVMFYTPDPQRYTTNFEMPSPGIGSQIPSGIASFVSKDIKTYEVTKVHQNYYPLIISINYEQAGKHFCFITYCVFRLKEKIISGVHVERQLAIINNIPFEIKQIFGGEDESSKKPQAEGEFVAEVSNQECVICLDTPSDTIIMPCGHMTVCKDCGVHLKSKNQPCPICRGAISSLLPYKKRA